MNTLLIGYDLDKPAQNYDNLIAEIKDISDFYWHHLDSTWLVKTNETPVSVRDKLAKHININYDKLLVMNITGAAAAWVGFTEQGGKWLSSNL